MRYVPNAEQKVSEWSGGTTTELYLYPPDGSYRERRFKIRLSTAVCRDETSVFMGQAKEIVWKIQQREAEWKDKINIRIELNLVLNKKVLWLGRL